MTTHIHFTIHTNCNTVYMTKSILYPGVFIHEKAKIYANIRLVRSLVFHSDYEAQCVINLLSEFITQDGTPRNWFISDENSIHEICNLLLKMRKIFQSDDVC